MNCRSKEHRVNQELFSLIGDGYEIASRQVSHAGEEIRLRHKESHRRLTLLWFPRLSYLQLCDQKRILKAEIL